MTVAELVERLKEFPQDAMVIDSFFLESKTVSTIWAIPFQAQVSAILTPKFVVPVSDDYEPGTPRQTCVVIGFR